MALRYGAFYLVVERYAVVGSNDTGKFELELTCHVDTPVSYRQP